jgi:hypothetical protein
MTAHTIAAALARRATIQRVATRLLATVVLTIAGCSSSGGADGATGPTKTPAGNYRLETIDATQPPVEVYHGPWFDSVNKRFYNQMVLLVNDGTITLDAAGRWSMTLGARVTLDGATSPQQIDVAGQYTIDGDQITLTMDGQNGSLSGSITKGTISLTMDFGGNKRFKAYAFTR